MKYFYALLFFLFTINSLNAQTCSSISDMLDYAQKYIGTRYVRGGTQPPTFDCSGFTQFCYKALGIILPRVSYEQVTVGEKVTLNNIQAGDLVFWKGSSAQGRIGHVGIVVEKTGTQSFKFIHASTSKGVTIADSEMNYFKQRYVTACRICEDGIEMEEEDIKIGTWGRNKENNEGDEIKIGTWGKDNTCKIDKQKQNRETRRHNRRIGIKVLSKNITTIRTEVPDSELDEDFIDEPK